MKSSKPPKTVKNLVGQTFGHWAVVSLLTRRTKNGGVYYKCRCMLCGKEYQIPASNLISGYSTRCRKCSDQPHGPNECKKGHNLLEWGRTSTGSCRACMKNTHLFQKYGITLVEFIAIYNHQQGKCAICQRELGAYQALLPNKGRMEVDHDHRLKGKASVRGLLCGGRWAGCNRKLGRIDNPEWLKSAAHYVEVPPAQNLLTKSKEHDTIGVENGN